MWVNAVVTMFLSRLVFGKWNSNVLLYWCRITAFPSALERNLSVIQYPLSDSWRLDSTLDLMRNYLHVGLRRYKVKKSNPVPSELIEVVLDPAELAFVQSSRHVILNELSLSRTCKVQFYCTMPTFNAKCRLPDDVVKI